MIQRLIRPILTFAIVLGVALWLSRANKPNVINAPAVISNSGDVLITHQSGKPDTHVYQSQPDSTIISTDSHGNVTVNVKYFGIGFDPGIGFAYADRLRLSLDSRILFYDRLGLNIGLAFALSGYSSLGGSVKPFLAASYALPFKKLSNTSIYAGCTLDRMIIGGLRVRL